MRLGDEQLSAVEGRFLRRVLDQVRGLDNALRGAYAEELVAHHLPEAVAKPGWSG